MGKREAPTCTAVADMLGFLTCQKDGRIASLEAQLAEARELCERGCQDDEAMCQPLARALAAEQERDALRERVKGLEEAHSYLLNGLKACTMPAGGVINAVINRKAQGVLDGWEQRYSKALAAQPTEHHFHQSGNMVEE